MAINNKLQAANDSDWTVAVKPVVETYDTKLRNVPTEYRDKLKLYKALKLTRLSINSFILEAFEEKMATLEEKHGIKRKVI